MMFLTHLAKIGQAGSLPKAFDNAAWPANQVRHLRVFSKPFQHRQIDLLWAQRSSPLLMQASPQDRRSV